MNAPAKIFTPLQANNTLPLVRRIVSDILKAGRQIREVSLSAEDDQTQKQLDALMDQLDELFEEIESLGCSYKDWNFSVGLVDFPAMVGGKEVLLCWKSDEDSVEYYHEPEAGFAGRKPLPADKEAS